MSSEIQVLCFKSIMCPQSDSILTLFLSDGWERFFFFKDRDSLLLIFNPLACSEVPGFSKHLGSTVSLFREGVLPEPCAQHWNAGRYCIEYQAGRSPETPAGSQGK